MRWSALQIPPEGFLYVFLPPLLFAGGLTVDVRRLFDDIAPVLVLAIFAVLMCMVAVGVTLNLVTGTSLDPVPVARLDRGDHGHGGGARHLSRYRRAEPADA